MASLLTGIMTSAVLSGVSLAYAALGEVVGQRAGVVNLGVEGLMLCGASAAFAATWQTGSPSLGIVFGGVAALLTGAVFAVVVIERQANQLAAGLTLMFFGAGLSALIGRPYVGEIINGLPRVPLLGVRFDWVTYAVVPLALALWWLLFRTRWGLALRAVGENPAVAFAAGKRPRRLRYQAILIGSFLAGIGGAHLSVGLTRTWAEDMTAGRGFIAIALVIFSKWHPILVIPAAIFFGAAESLQLQLQAAGADVSPFALTALPYLLTLALLCLWGWRRQSVAPAALGRAYAGVE